MNMEVKIEKPKSYVRELTISLPYENLERERKRIAETYRNRSVIPGFRKGKAPLRLILNKFDKDIEKEAKDNIIKNGFMEALRENNLNPVSYANIENVEITDDKKNIRFRANFQVIPDFELNLKTIKTTYKSPKINNEDVNKVLSDLQEKYTTLKPTSKSSKIGNSIEFDYKVFDETDNQLESLEGMVLECKKVRDKNSIYSLLPGLKSGEKTKAHITYPVEFPMIELHGKPVSILIETREVKEKIIPRLDDDFAKIVSLDSLRELKESIRGQLSKENEAKAIDSAYEELINKLLKANDFEIPEAIIDYYFKRQMEEMKTANKKNINEDDVRKFSERMARLNIILDNIAEKEKLHIPDNEIEKVLDKMGFEEDISMEEKKRFLEQSGRLDDIITILKREKSYDFLKKNFLIKG